MTGNIRTREWGEALTDGHHVSSEVMSFVYTPNDSGMRFRVVFVGLEDLGAEGLAAQSLPEGTKFLMITRGRVAMVGARVTVSDVRRQLGDIRWDDAVALAELAAHVTGCHVASCREFTYEEAQRQESPWM